MLQPRLGGKGPRLLVPSQKDIALSVTVLVLGLCHLTAGDISLVNSDNSQFIANEYQQSNADLETNPQLNRVKRNLGDVNATLLSNSSESKVYGLISSAARTFVQDGITTEFTTQLIGTNIGSSYARIINTGSKILYGNLRSRPANSEPYLIYPTVNNDFDIAPTNVQEVNGEYQTITGDFDVPTLKDILSNSQDDLLETSEARNIVSPTESNERTPSMEREEEKPLKDSRENSERVPDSENVISVKKEYSSSKNNGEFIKPQKVKAKANLPTYTIKNGYDTFAFDDDATTEEAKYDSNLYRKPVIIKNDINFEAIGKKQQRLSKNLLYNRNKDREAQKEKDQPSSNHVEESSEKSKLVTTTYFGFADFTTTVGNTVIHFMPNTPVAKPNNLVTSIKDEATLRNELIRPSKVQNIIFKTNVPNSLLSLNKHRDHIEASQSEHNEKSSRHRETEPLYKYRSSTTRIYNTEAQPLGLVKSIGGIESYEGTTTEYTTFVYGTYINGDYKQLLQSATNIKIDPTKSLKTAKVGTSSAHVDKPTTTPKAEEEPISENLTESDVKRDKVENENKVEGSEPVELVVKTSYKTYTYLTTFFIPVNDDLTTTSVKSRDVVSSIVTYVPVTIKPTKAVEVIKPSEEVTTPLTSTPDTTTTNAPTTTTEEAHEVTVPIPDENENATTESSSEKEDPSTSSTTLDKVPTTTPKSKVQVDEENKEEEDNKFTTLDSYETTESVIVSTTEKKSFDANSVPSPTPTIKSEKLPEDNEEVELIFKTLYTTYTYLTTYFEESTSSIASREEIVTNVVTSTIDKSFFSNDAVEGLFERNENSLISSDAEKVKGTNLVTSENSTELVDGKTMYTTFTYYTTFFEDNEKSVTSRIDVVTNIIKPTVTIPDIIENTYTTTPKEDSDEVLESTTPLIASSYSDENISYSTTETLDDATEKHIEGADENVKNIKPGKPQERKFTYDTTMSRNHEKVTSNNVEDEEESLENFDEDYPTGVKERDSELNDGEKLPKNSYRNEYMVNYINSTRSKETINRKMIILNDSEEDQISSETNTEETEPSLLLQTSYTTFTYFTTLYKGASSDIVSRLETVTNVITETVQPTVVTENILDLENEDVPITYYTTFTYWTTLYREGSTMITSREETQSNIITPTVNKASDANTMDITPTPTVPIEATATSSPNQTGDLLEPTTYFTTYTYFTTSYLDNSTIVNSRLETETNVVTPSETIVESAEAKPTPALSSLVDQSEITKKLEPTGLISTIAITDVLEGITTILSTDVFGTYIDGLYAQVLESTTKILSSEIESDVKAATLAPSESSSVSLQEREGVKPTGVVSLNEGSIIDAEGITTTFYTTKAIGTYIDGLYAQVIESTSSIKIDEERKTTLPDNDPATTVIGDKSYKTGLVKIIEGQMVKDKTTTFYESKVIGTIIDDRYAQVIESTSSVSIEPTAIPDEAITPTATQAPELNINPTSQPTVAGSTPAVESSLGEKSEDEDEEDNKIGSKKKFAPVIRPFASRPRPTFLPKKKTGEPAIAQTITRGITPTIVATPALKATSVNNVFGASSRNRFAASRRPSPASAPVSDNVENIRATSSSRKFSRPSKTSGSPISSFLPSSRRGGSSSARVIPTPTPIASSSRRGPNYRTSAPVRPSSDLGLRSTGPNSRFRVRPTPTSSSARASTISTTPEPPGENDYDINNTDEEEEEQEEPIVTTTTTTESSRRQNPLLRLRRPPLGRTAASPTPPPPPSQNIPTTRATLRPPSNGRATTTKPTTTTRRGQSPSRTNGNKGTTTTTSKPTTTRPRPVFNNNNRPRPRPANSLLPGRLPARKPVEEPKEEEPLEELLDEEKNQAVGQINEEESDNFFDGSETEESKPVKNEEDNKILRKPSAPVSIRPFSRRRNKRQVDFGSRYDTRNSRSNRRPAPRIQSSDYYYYDDDVPVTEAPRIQPRQRFSSRNQQPQQQLVQQQQQQQFVQQKITPATTQNYNARQQFTLRESKPVTTTPRTNYRRPAQSRRQETTTSAPKRPSPPRLKSQFRETSRKSTDTRKFNPSSNTRRTPSTRQRFTTENFNNAYVPPIDDGSITVTLKTPTEVTIPVFNGKFTEYKNVLTAKPSFETLGPHQYTNVMGKNGIGSLQYVNEVTETLQNGNTEITKFVIFETPTTAIVFTPTTIRGRKTSFSHVVPSTIYEVRPEVSTITPNLGNAPLANLLLSQLLLGNLNLQQTANPLGVINQAPMTPVTEYKTKSTTYVTTVTSISSAVLPLTFRGKEITTTIVETSTQVITATEYMTETVVITPTAVANPAIPAANQFNTLLLPALLQAQLLQQATPTPVTNFLPDVPLTEDEAQKTNARVQSELQVEEVDANQEDKYSEEKISKKKAKYGKQPEPQPVASSIVTLYVSGRRPGEFSTVLSTYYEDNATQRKREVTVDFLKMEASDVKPSKLAFFDNKSGYDIDDIVMSAINDISVESSEVETQPLETKYLLENFNMQSSAPNLKSQTVDPHLDPNIDPGEALFDIITFGQSDSEQNKNKTGYFLAFSPADITPHQQGRAYTRSTQRIVKRDLVDSDHTKDKTALEARNKTEKLHRKIVLKKKHNASGHSSEEVTTWKPYWKKKDTLHEYHKGDGHIDTENGNESKNEFIKILESNENPASGKKIRVVKRLKMIPNGPNEELITSEETIDGLGGKVVKKQLETQELFRTDYSDFDITKLTLRNLNSTRQASTLEDLPLAKERDSFEGSVLLNGGEARLNLATKVMSNGVQVIVAGDRTTYPGDNHYRILTANVTRPITLAPSTISNHMVMLLPHETQNLNNQFITKTYLTTYTYLTTFLQANQTKTTSSEEVISNVVTEDVKNPSTAPVMQNQITLTSPVDLVTQVYHTTYTYLNTLLDEEQPIVLTTKKTILNTVTSLSSDLENAVETSYDVIQDTNTYINTVQFTKTISDGLDHKVISTQDVLTQVIITQSDKPAGATPIEQIQPSTTDITKTYLVTYTYFNTLQEEDGNTRVTSDIAVSSDVVTEKFHLQTKKPEFHEKGEHKKPVNIKDKIKEKNSLNHTEQPKPDKVEENNIEPTETAMLFESESNNIHIFATKTYLTTYTYFTTLLSNEQTVVNSRTKVIENLVTETLATSHLDQNQMSSLRSSLRKEDKIIATATLKSGEKVEVTAMHNVPQDYHNHKTQPYHNEIQSSYDTDVKKTAGVNIDHENKKKTPILQSKLTINKNPHEKTQGPQKDKVAATNVKHNSGTSYLTSSTVTKNGATLLPGTPVIKVTDRNGFETVIPVSDPISKHPDSKPSSGGGMNDLLSLGSISHGLSALRPVLPVLSAMAGYIKNNLKASETKNKNESLKVSPLGSSPNYRFPTFSKNDQPKTPAYPQRNEYEEKSTPNSLRSSTRAPIYIPLSGLSNERDIEPQESQVIESNQYADVLSRNTIHSASLKGTSEKPLLNGGIPISPGEVITANSDVIVGRPSVLGVRPPETKKPKDDFALGMKPPPPPVSYKENIFSSSNKEETKYSPVKFNPLPAATPHLVEYNDIIPDLRPPAPPQFSKQKPKLPSIRPTKVSNEYPFHQNPNPFQQKPFSGPNMSKHFPNAQIDIQKGSQIYEEHESQEAHVISGSQHIESYEHFENREPVVIQESAPQFVEHSSVDPLLVNLQPSQVANVVIPHGSQTALIYSDQGNKHGPKGEVYDEAAPSSALGVKIYSSPPTAVGAMSSTHIYTMNNVQHAGNVHQAVIPNDQMNFNVAVAPNGINVGHGNIHYGNKPKPQSDQRIPVQHGTVHSDNIDRPRPDQKPVSYQTNEQIHIHKKPPHINEEYLGPPPPLPPDDFTNDGELIQESNTRPLTPGQVPDEIQHKQNNYKSPPPSSPAKPSVEYLLQYGSKKRPQAKPTSDYPFEKVKPTGQGVLEYQNPNNELKYDDHQEHQNKPLDHQSGYSQQNKQPFDQHKQEQYNRNQAEQLQQNEKLREQQKVQYEQHVRDQQKQYEQQKQKYEEHLRNQHKQQQQLEEHKQHIRDSQKNSIALQSGSLHTDYNTQNQKINAQNQKNQEKYSQQQQQEEQQKQNQEQYIHEQQQQQQIQQHIQEQYIQHNQQQQHQKQQNNIVHQNKTPLESQSSEDYEEEQLKLEQEVLNILHQHQEQLNKYATKPIPAQSSSSSPEYSNVPGHSNTHLQQHANQKPQIETHGNEWHEVGHDSTTSVEPQLEYTPPTTVTYPAKPQYDSTKKQTVHSSPNNAPYHQNGHQIPLQMYDKKYEQNHQSEEGLSAPRPTLNELDIKAQIITGKPEKENSFHGNAQVLSIGKPTLLTPEGTNEPASHSVGSSITFETKPHTVGSSITFEKKPHSVGSSISFGSEPSGEDNSIASSDLRQKVKGTVTAVKDAKPVLETNEIKPFTSNEVRPILPSDPTVATMNMDEKIPPPPVPVRTKAPEPPSGEVLGLSPPPVQRYQEDVRPTTRRPPFRLRPPNIPRPPISPYKFELPAANTTKLEKPTIGKVESVSKWQTSTTKKPVNLLRPNDNSLAGPIRQGQRIENAQGQSFTIQGQRVEENNQGQKVNINVLMSESSHRQELEDQRDNVINQGQRPNDNIEEQQEQRLKSNNRGQRPNDNNSSLRPNDNSQGQRLNGNSQSQGQRLNGNSQSQGQQGERLNGNSQSQGQQGQRLNGNNQSQGQRLNGNNQSQGQRLNGNIQVAGVPHSVNGASINVAGHYLKPEVMVAPSKVAMYDIKPSRPAKPTAPPVMQTVVLGKPIAQDVIATQITGLEPGTHSTGDVIVKASESEEDSPTRNEPKIKTLLAKTGTTTVFTNLYTKPTLKIKPTRTTVAHHSVISMVIDKDANHQEVVDSSVPEISGVEVHEEDQYQIGNMQGSMTELPTRFVTHTQTLSVTITETTVIQSSGQKPSTHTLVLTKTHTSTMIDTVTEFHTLLKPTKILATVTTTVPVPVTATHYFTGSAHPEPVNTRDDLITAPPPGKKNPHENESILLVVTDKKQGAVPLIERPVVDIQVPDETNEINPNDVLISGILTHSSDIDCKPECKTSRNEICQRRAESNTMRCVCRPGFSRMFVDRPCKPTYSYQMKLVLDRNGKEKIRYSETLHDESSPGYLKLAAVTRDGLDRLVMQSELRDVYQGLEINKFDAGPGQAGESALVNFHLQLSDNTEDVKIKDVLKKSLRHTNYSLGGTEVFAAKEYLQSLEAEDFDECTSPRYHDCSENAQCFNLKGTYTCSCKDGYIDASHNPLYPGRVCNELTGCESCNYHGTCYTEGQNEIVCECFHWYTGEHCQINLKVLLLGLLAAGVLLTLLLIVCLLVGGRRRQRGPPNARALLKIQARHNAGFRRYIGPSAPLAGDKRAIVMNSSSSSEASVEATPPPYVKQAMTTASAHQQRAAKMMGRKGHRAPAPPSSMGVPGPGSRSSTFRSEDHAPQRDRSLTVMIPRAKYRAPPPMQCGPQSPTPMQCGPSAPTPSSLMTMSTFGPTESKLLNYLTVGVERSGTPDKQASRSSSRKPSNSTNHSTQQITHRKSTPPRKPSTGALVSAGYEVSATVGRTKELDEAYMAQPHPQDNTIRTGDRTVSEARSYDETTIAPPTRSYGHPHYTGRPGHPMGSYSGGGDSKHSSSGKTHNDEGHTMVERDLGSTYLMPQRHLYKLDHSRQGSDGSNFDSL